MKKIRQSNAVILCLALALIMLSPLAPNSAEGAESPGPSALVKAFQDQLIEVMKVAEKLPVMERYQRLAPTVDNTFHLPLMAQISAGNYWNDAPRDQREALAQSFRRMSIATLATLFDGYSGETFAVDNERPGPSQTTLVMTSLTKSDNSKIKIAYVARQFRIGWRLIDVIVDSGISELKVRRSEYNQMLKKQGVPALIKLLNSKADELISQ